MMKFQAVAALLSVTQGARIKRSSQQVHIAGVRVHEHIEGVNDWIMLFKEGTTEAAMQRTCAGQCEKMGHPSKGGAAFAIVKGTDKLESLLKQHGDDVEVLEQDRTDYIIPDIPEIDEPGVASSASWGLERIGVSDRATTGRGVHIYIQDTGIRVSHTDFGGRAAPAIDLTSGDLEECGAAPTSCSSDQHGHGSHCAATAAGSSYGVASQANVHAVKTLGANGGARSWQIVAMDWVVSSPLAQRPAVISASLGGSGADPSYTTVINAATEAGVTIVVAGGNSNADACNFSPAFAANAITVGSTDEGDARSSFSNYGACVNIWAPGRAIISASHTSDTGSTPMSGTSMACPHVSGAAALILEANPSYAKDQVLEALYAGGYENIVTDLKAGDTNQFLYVGAGGPPAYTTLAPTPVPTPAPTPERIPCPSFASGPDGDGDCKCGSGKCSLDGGLTFMCPTSGSPGGWGGVYFLPTCTDCECVAPVTTTTTRAPGSSCPSFSTGPDRDGDCMCRSGRCSLDGGVTFMCPTSAAPGGWGGRYFLPSCTACECTR